MSFVPPGAVATTMRTGRDGYDCTRVMRDTTGNPAPPAASCRNCLRWGSFMGFSQNRLKAARCCACTNGFQNEKGLPAAGTNAADKSNGDFSARPVGSSVTSLHQVAHAENGLMAVRVKVDRASAGTELRRRKICKNSKTEVPTKLTNASVPPPAEGLARGKVSGTRAV